MFRLVNRFPTANWRQRSNRVEAHALRKDALQALFSDCGSCSTFSFDKWAATWENVPYDICVQRRKSNQPEQSRGVIRAFIVRMKKLCILGYQKLRPLKILIKKTCLCKFEPLKPYFYMVKLGFTGVNIIFLISAQNIDCGYSLEPPHRGGSNECPKSMFWAEIWKYQSFLSENFQFLEVKFSIYLNRRVFVMWSDCRLIWIFTRRTCPRVRFLTLQLNQLSDAAVDIFIFIKKETNAYFCLMRCSNNNKTVYSKINNR